MTEGQRGAEEQGFVSWEEMVYFSLYHGDPPMAGDEPFYFWWYERGERFFYFHLARYGLGSAQLLLQVHEQILREKRDVDALKAELSDVEKVLREGGELEQSDLESIKKKKLELNSRLESLSRDKWRYLNVTLREMETSPEAHFAAIRERTGPAEHSGLVRHIADLERLTVLVMVTLEISRRDLFAIRRDQAAQYARLRVGQLAYCAEKYILLQVGGQWAEKFKDLSTTDRREQLVHNFYELNDAYCKGEMTATEKDNYEKILTDIYNPSPNEFKDASRTLKRELKAMKDARINDAHPPLKMSELMLYVSDKRSKINLLKFCRGSGDIEG